MNTVKYIERLLKLSSQNSGMRSFENVDIILDIQNEIFYFGNDYKIIKMNPSSNGESLLFYQVQEVYNIVFDCKYNYCLIKYHDDKSISIDYDLDESQVHKVKSIENFFNLCDKLKNNDHQGREYFPQIELHHLKKLETLFKFLKVSKETNYQFIPQYWGSSLNTPCFSEYYCTASLSEITVLMQPSRMLNSIVERYSLGIVN